MAKTGETFGGRWEVVKKINSGGQGEVLRVKDLKEELREDQALKLVFNRRKRRDRFLNEVKAIKTLSHPNIIELVDHSALDDAESQYLVMPLADSDLTSRAAFCKGMVDPTVAIAAQVANGLAYAHRSGVIHRDIKPGNLLFLRSDSKVLIADFGICLIRDETRGTELDELVGPRFFMAPELEGGGQLNVTPAADVYSLGKVIFYLISGGKILPREPLLQESYAHYFSGGQRHNLLRGLLARMVVEAPAQRIQTMEEVHEQLQHIIRWELTARSPISDEAAAKMQELQLKIITTQQEEDRSRSVKAQALESVENIKEPFSEWLTGLLNETAHNAKLSGVMAADVTQVSEVDAKKILGMHAFNQEFVLGVELRLKPVTGHTTHVLQFMLCFDRSKDHGILLRFFPAYRRSSTGGFPDYGFVNSKSWFQSKLSDFDTTHTHISRSAKMSAPQCEFQPLEFLQNADKLRSVYEESLFVFLDHIDKEPYAIGP
jgi:serine/threonine protein kinase